MSQIGCQPIILGVAILFGKSETNCVPLITSETAREFSAKGNAVLAARRAERLNARIDPEKPRVIPENTFQSETLARVRKQIKVAQDNIDDGFKKHDSKAVKEWTDSLARLNEIERQLSGRPMPGSLKPSAPKNPRRSADPEPEFEPAPEPIPEASCATITSVQGIWRDNPTPQ